MKKNVGLLSVALLIAAMSGRRRDIFDMPLSTPRQRKEWDEFQKERNHRLNPVNISEREFIIKGESIMAHNHRTALKIYANRHPEIKKRKK